MKSIHILFVVLLLLTSVSLVYNEQHYTIDEKMVKDKEHLAEHAKSENLKKKLEDMSDKELELYYFHEHDRDQNKLLDGTEIMMSLIENLYHNHNTSDSQSNQEPKKFDESELILFIDSIMKNDKNNDGYLNFKEFQNIYKQN